MSHNQPIRFEPSPKRIRAIIDGETIADSLKAVLLLEKGHLPVYYFPRDDVRLDLLERSGHSTHCPHKGDASYWHAKAGDSFIENAAWGYEEPIPESRPIEGYIAFYWDKMGHWLEEDEEVIGHPHDPYHRIDLRLSERTMKVMFGGETIAKTGRSLFLFETGLPTRYYIPPEDVRTDFLERMKKTTICAYKGTAS
ncbi:DUF427 domain-containing protein, partial [Lutimaribacter sp. EGI FJ00014]|nr:DUF427 domain-containing protein [Lutimaribacter sp. EGI FJ00014]